MDFQTNYIHRAITEEFAGCSNNIIVAFARTGWANEYDNRGQAYATSYSAYISKTGDKHCGPVLENQTGMECLALFTLSMTEAKDPSNVKEKSNDMRDGHAENELRRKSRYACKSRARDRGIMQEPLITSSFNRISHWSTDREGSRYGVNESPGHCAISDLSDAIPFETRRLRREFKPACRTTNKLLCTKTGPCRPFKDRTECEPYLARIEKAMRTALAEYRMDRIKILEDPAAIREAVASEKARKAAFSAWKVAEKAEKARTRRRRRWRFGDRI